MAPRLSVTRRWLATAGFLLVICTAICSAQLSESFYSTTCPQMLSIVKTKVAEFIAADRGLAGGFLRLQFHDCFVRTTAWSPTRAVHSHLTTSIFPRCIPWNFILYPSHFSNKISKQLLLELWEQDILSNPSNVKTSYFDGYHSSCILCVQGCDASVLLRSLNNTAELDAIPNVGSIRGLSQIDEVKLVLETVCPGIVSCADIIALVARDAMMAIGGPIWSVPQGRRDGFVSSKDEALASIPSPNDNFGQLVRNFASVGLSVQDLVMLSGAHTIGRSHCGPVLRRLYNFTGLPGAMDPSLDPTFAKALMLQCPQNIAANVIAMDSTNGTFDSTFFNDLLANRGIFTSDATLLSNPFSLGIINTSVQTPSFFLSNFAAAMVRMGNVSVLTGSVGEVRRICSKTNNS